MGNVTFPAKLDGPEKYVAGFNFCSFHTSSRHSYYTGMLFDYRNYGPYHNTKCLVKVKGRFSPKSSGVWATELARISKAEHIARGLTKVCPTLKIRFLSVCPVEIDETSSIFSVLLRFINGRPLQPYEWVLVSSYMTDVQQLEQNNPYRHPALGALSHYSWHASDGELVMCDFRGSLSDNTYTLLPPTIHSKGAAYGDKDSGEDGIQKFFRRHLCTNLCKSFSHPSLVSKPEQDTGDSKEESYANMSLEQSVASKVLGMKPIDIKKS